jgi:hypothetical protein
MVVMDAVQNQNNAAKLGISCSKQSNHYEEGSFGVRWVSCSGGRWLLKMTGAVYKSSQAAFSGLEPAASLHFLWGLCYLQVEFWLSSKTAFF